MKLGKWIMETRGKRWKYVIKGTVRGFVVATFNGWDGYVVTGSKWPNDRRVVRNPRGDDRIWAARKMVEWAIEDSSPGEQKS
jgi:hypothetical protein